MLLDDGQSLALAPSLVNLRMSHCELAGQLTEQLFFQSDAIILWPMLVTLDLGHNSISGNIPFLIRIADSISFLDLSYNLFTGNVTALACATDATFKLL